ncbi:MAG TPA: ABC transporter permease [Vicinamibacterales bacterium]
MTAVDVVRFAGGALRGHRLRTGLSLLGVAVGVMSVVLLTSLGEGARVFVTGEFASLGSNLLIVMPGKVETTGFAPPIGGAPHDLTLDDAEALRRLPGVRRVAPMAIGSATARAGDLTRDAIVIGATAEWREVRRIEMGQGRFLPAGDAERDRPVCVVGRVIARELFPGRSAVGELLRLGDERCRVIGVIAPRGTSLGMNLDDLVLIPVVRHMKMFDETSLPRILIEMRSHEDLPAGRLAVIGRLKNRHDEEDVTIVTQDSMLATFSRLLSVLTAALAGIAAISLSVAGVGIMNVMLVSVAERRREIGLLKALGATSGQVLRIFLTEAATLSAFGGLVGLAAASLATTVVRSFYPSFPMQPPAWAMPAALVVSLAVGLLFGALPARRAAALDPILAMTRR